MSSICHAPKRTFQRRKLFLLALFAYLAKQLALLENSSKKLVEVSIFQILRSSNFSFTEKSFAPSSANKGSNKILNESECSLNFIDSVVFKASLHFLIKLPIKSPASA